MEVNPDASAAGPDSSAMAASAELPAATTSVQVEHPTISTNTSNSAEPSVKPKQKRNKPTLSCLDCVERKTKCDRGRPCLACIKRQSNCQYTPVAELIAAADQCNTGHNGKARYLLKRPSKSRKTGSSSSSISATPAATVNSWRGLGGRRHRSADYSSATSPFQFSSVPYSQSSPSNVFGVGAQHPFSNFWTLQGGLPEVITVLPNKEQADVLIAKYFDAVDPVYPFLHRRTFYAEYEGFWMLTPDEKGRSDASLVALHYAIYALGTQFTHFESYEEGSQTAEFYCSAANQALRVYSYLNRTSIRAIQAMLLMTYFLMNDNHASDAYAWAGIHLRQAYAMRLHRDPDIAVPEASALEKQQRRKLWQAVFDHDTFLTTLLKLPPTATHSDVPVESLADAIELSSDGLEVCLGTHSRVENLMSINVIAPQIGKSLLPLQPHHAVDPTILKSDVAYMRAAWHLGNLVQDNLSSVRALSLPIANSPREKDILVSAFERLLASFPAHLTQLDLEILREAAVTQPRAVRQNLFLTSNYYHCLMLVQASENRSAGVAVNIEASLNAAHEALWAFFKLWKLFESEAQVWWVFQHRALEESLLIAELSTTLPLLGAQSESLALRAKEDIGNMLEIMRHYGGNTEMHRARREMLQEAFDRFEF